MLSQSKLAVTAASADHKPTGSALAAAKDGLLPADDLTVRYFDVEIDHDRLLKDAASIAGLAFPDWNMASGDVAFHQETDGITNKLVRCHHKPTGTMVLIRTYGRGSDVLIDRKQELMNMLALSKLGLCPPLYARFKNGLVYGYIEGSPFTVPDMQDPHKSNLVASNLGVWHKVQLPIPRRSKLFSTMRRWLDAVPDHFTNPETEQRTTAFISKAMLRAELDTLESALEALNAPIVFSHCDLLCNNIIYTPRTDTVQFIDYEYGCYAPRGFDIGNHFCEHAGFDCEWERYPGEAFQKQWLKAYLAASGEPNPSREDIQRLYAEVNKYALAAHLYWGLWALVQAEISDLDFDYAGYAMLRLTEYLRRKAEFLAL